MQTKVVVGVVVLLTAIAATACVDDAVEMSTTEQDVRCPILGCSNSDELIVHGIMDLNLKGVANAQGATLEMGTSGRAQIFTSSGVAYDLYVNQGTITGRRRGLIFVAGQQLVGSELHVLFGSEPFHLRIDAVRTMNYPVGAVGTLEVYTISWHDAAGANVPGKNACIGYDENLRDPSELLDMYPQETLLFEGDRIDPLHKTISGVLDADWVNFGCAGKALAKLRLTRNSSIENSNRKERQATLKLLAADYCGTGRAFTVTGVPIRWMGGAMHYWTTPVALEARWDENGAKCLNTIRLDQLDPPSTYFPPNHDGRWNQIQATCALAGHAIPMCTGADADPYTIGTSLRVSALPVE